MADKPKVKAPKQRSTQRRAEDDAKRRRMVMLGAGGVIALVVIVGIGVLLGVGAGGPSAGDVREKLVAAGCTMRAVDAQPGEHTLAADDTSEDWNTDPPTSGPHFGFDANQNLGTVIWGAYEEPIQLARIVHNLEHGGVYIFYGDRVRDPVIAELRAFYDDHENGTVLAPYPKLGNQIALGAWNLNDDGSEKAYLAKCRNFDEDAFSAFFSAFQFKGPERFPASSLLPGGN
jgi:Protein of unknown function (DUF3105)